MFVAARVNIDNQQRRSYGIRAEDQGPQIAVFYTDDFYTSDEGACNVRYEGAAVFGADVAYLIGAIAWLLKDDDGNSHCAASAKYVTAEIEDKATIFPPRVTFRIDGKKFDGINFTD
jgi:hypothetical protein